MFGKGYRIFFLVSLMGVVNSVNVSAQTDSASTSPKPAMEDTIKKAIHSPKKAAIYSAILPGAGQVYNKKYWKLGVLAAGAGGLAFAVHTNQSRYTLYKSELIKRQQNQGGYDAELDQYTDSNLQELQNYYRRFRDLSLIGVVFLYALNILDAAVDAHLMDFDISTDLSLQLRPQPVFSSISSVPFPGLGLTFGF
jgi:hypothetical protein